MEGESTEFTVGVIDGYHYHGKVSTYYPDLFPRDPGALYQAAGKHAEIASKTQWNDEQCLDYIRGFVAGVRVREKGEGL